jgi:DNA modification methylase
MPSQTNLNLTTQLTGPVECLGQTFPSEAARREHYLGLLAEKLQDPEFRKIEGFPIGEDEDILALSDPPYYTVCPNPWIGDFIEHHGRPYDPTEKYHREPFAADVKENKHHPIYVAHTYHTKSPHRAIMRYILHYTKPGDVVFDAFAGTGMAGVAAQLCGDSQEVQGLGYRVNSEGSILDESGKLISKIGSRRAVLNDLAPAATFIAQNYNAKRDVSAYRATSEKVFAALQSRLEWMFMTLHEPSTDELDDVAKSLRRNDKSCLNKSTNFGRINYAIWSDVFLCDECSKEVIFWDSAVDQDNGKVRDEFACPHCNEMLRKRNLERAFTVTNDHALGTLVKQAKAVPVRICYSFGGHRYEKKADVADLALIEMIAREQVPSWFPSDRMPEGVETRRNDSSGITHFHHFYTPRNLRSFAVAYSLLPSSHKWIVTGALQRGSKQHQIAITRIGGEKAGDGGATAGHRRGTLYIPSNQVEMNALELMRDRARSIASAVQNYEITDGSIVTTQSAGSINIPDDSIDYFFFDPPFGANIAYSELNSIFEAWLKVYTNNKPEAIEDRGQKKTLQDYRELITECFRRVYRMLKPGRWMTVEFSNTQAAVWNALQSALQEVGFVVANVSFLDKGRGGLMAIVGPVAVKQDLAISAYKPNGGLEERFRKTGHTIEGVWDFMRTHLRNLPVVKPRGGELEFIAERDPRILYDRMVAFYVGHGVPVPLSSAEFQRELADKFPEREGMFFLSEQVAEFDKKRAQMEGVGQMSIFVEDEKSAIDWLRGFLKNRPSVISDVTPEFMQQLGASWKKFETRPELQLLLDQNFLQYKGHEEVPSQIHSYLSTQNKDLRSLPKDDTRLQARAKDRWYVPDPAKAVDKEAMRNKRLLEEFWGLCDAAGIARPKPGDANQPTLPIAMPAPIKKSGRKKAKEVRTEAIRMGFKECFGRKDYSTILAIAQHLPNNVIEEDEQLQMIHDMAEMRSNG